MNENFDIGGLLSNYMDQRKIRVYIKDTVMKRYVQSRQGIPTLSLKALKIPEDAEMIKEYKRPQGRLLKDGRGSIAWGRACDWKLVLTALHERSYRVGGVYPYAAVLMSADGRYHQSQEREIVQDASDKLGIKHLIWLAA